MPSNINVYLKASDIKNGTTAPVQHKEFVVRASLENGEYVLEAKSASRTIVVRSSKLGTAKRALQYQTANVVAEKAVLRTNKRGKAARDAVKDFAEQALEMTHVAFEQRGQYKDWYIIAIDAVGEAFEKRLDVFKKFHSEA